MAEKKKNPMFVTTRYTSAGELEPIALNLRACKLMGVDEHPSQLPTC